MSERSAIEEIGHPFTVIAVFKGGDTETIHFDEEGRAYAHFDTLASLIGLARSTEINLTEPEVRKATLWDNAGNLKLAEIEV